MIRTSATLLLLSCVACADAPVSEPSAYGIRLDPSLSPDQSELVMNAYKDWYVHTGVNYFFIVSSEECKVSPDVIPTSGCVHIRYGSVDEANAACGIVPGHIHVGCTNTKLLEGHVYVANVILASLGDYTKDYQIALHEAGHSMGLRHDPIHGTLMNAEMEDAYPDITELDVIQFKTVHQE